MKLKAVVLESSRRPGVFVRVDDIRDGKVNIQFTVSDGNGNPLLSYIMIPVGVGVTRQCEAILNLLEGDGDRDSDWGDSDMDELIPVISALG